MDLTRTLTNSRIPRRTNNTNHSQEKFVLSRSFIKLLSPQNTQRWLGWVLDG